jgi:malonate decarboxylase epsilon subunit
VIGLLFPGQGSQPPGMRSTVDVQLLLLERGVASARALAAAGVEPDALAGHSVGGFAAAVTAGAIAYEDAEGIVRERARAMEALFPLGYGMAVIAGLPERTVRALAGDAYIANINAPMQIVLAGTDAALARAVDAAIAQGARRAERLDVPVPSHCGLLEPVARRLHEMLAEVDVRDPKLPIVGSVGPRVIRDAEALRDDLARGVAHEVRWHDASTLLVEMGATLLIEAAPGHVLSDLAQQAFPDVRAIALETSGSASAAALARRA